MGSISNGPEQGDDAQEERRDDPSGFSTGQLSRARGQVENQNNHTQQGEKRKNHEA
jgi:hypothetical protein